MPSGPSSALISRSLPTLLLARTTRPMSTCPDALTVERLHLPCEELANPTCGKIEHGIQLVPAKRVPFGRALNLDERPAVIHDDVHVGFRLRILRVVEIQHGDTVENTHRNRRDLPVEGARCGRALLD